MLSSEISHRPCRPLFFINAVLHFLLVRIMHETP
jgi:hypothetical protein